MSRYPYCLRGSSKACALGPCGVGVPVAFARAPSTICPSRIRRSSSVPGILSLPEASVVVGERETQRRQVVRVASRPSALARRPRAARRGPSRPSSRERRGRSAACNRPRRRTPRRRESSRGRRAAAGRRASPVRAEARAVSREPPGRPRRAGRSPPPCAPTQVCGVFRGWYADQRGERRRRPTTSLRDRPRHARAHEERGRASHTRVEPRAQKGCDQRRGQRAST